MITANPMTHHLPCDLATLMTVLIKRGRKVLPTLSRDHAGVSWQVPGGGTASAFERDAGGPLGSGRYCVVFRSQPIPWDGHIYAVQAEKAFDRPPFLDYDSQRETEETA
ncbi:MAG: hypothetical protein K0U16_07150 [Gammaproteobacteria bacterium]|nr:hypothetical protein [Gammaproteobacteria bacterium]